DVVGDGILHIIERPDGPFGCRTRAGADGRRAGGRFSPATFQFIERGVELAPLTTREESPFQGVLQTLIIRSITAPGDFGAGAPDLEPVQNFMVPGPILGALADACFQPLPVAGGDWVMPIVKVREDASDRPEGTGVPNVWQVGEGFDDAGVTFTLVRPPWELRQARSGRTAGGIEVGDDHVIKQ